MDVRTDVRRAVRASRDARQILATHESSKARTVTIEDSYRKLGSLSLSQDDLIRQSLRAIESGLNRAAIVMAWAAFMDFVEEKLGSNGFKALNSAYPDWRIKDVDDLRDKKPDFQIIEALRAVKLTSKNETKSIQGMLSIRNESAHPSHFLPNLNQSLGYVSDVISRIEQLKSRRPKKR